ncbi:MAG: hypothetical protein EA358_07905 [Flavobacteriales bacterium]|nr:MAG: hypothetical protein EA358_07905 [Flavobacteriales bacterium]
MFVLNIQAQNVTKIEGIVIVDKNDTLSFGPGAILEFAPSAWLDVHGTLIINGTESNPVKLISKNPNLPGVGITIRGANYNSSITIKHATFDNLSQSLRFSPLWYRNQIDLDGLKFINGSYSDPQLYIGMPLTDLRDQQQISFSITNTDFIRNKSGMIVEGFGSSSIDYSFDKLYFADNTLAGESKEIGVLHIVFDRFVSNQDDLVTPLLGSMAFERNFSGSKEVGISVYGSSSQKVQLNQVVFHGNQSVISDRNNDFRLPLVELTQVDSDFLAFGREGAIRKAYSSNGKLAFATSGNIDVVGLLDSDNVPIAFDVKRLEDSLIVTFSPELSPSTIEFNTGNALNTSAPYFVEIAEDKPTESAGPGDADAPVFEEEESRLKLIVPIPVFKGKNEVVRSLKTWEVGLNFGGNIMGGNQFGGGGIRHAYISEISWMPNFVKDIPVVNGFPLPSTMEYSYGLFAQYNINTRFSAKFAGFAGSVSLHNPFAPAYSGPGRTNFSYDSDFNEFRPFNASTSALNVLTRFQMLEAEAIWHLRRYEINPGKKYKLIPSGGFNMGFMHFNPYRVAGTDYVRGEDESGFSFRRNARRQANLYNLRDVGTEGQHFLMDHDPYGRFAMTFGASASATLLFKRFTIKGEARLIFTSTDYLDDMGTGQWAGGDINRVVQNHQLGSEVDDRLVRRLVGFDPNVAPGARRSFNGLTDWFYQFHIGVSYQL